MKRELIVFQSVKNQKFILMEHVSVNMVTIKIMPMENVLKTVGPTKSVLTDFANVSLVMLELLKEYVAHMYQLQEDAHQAQSGCLVNANPQHCVV